MRAHRVLTKFFQGLGLATALAAVAAPGISHAADFPSKPIKIIVPYAPGGAVDIVTRLIAQKMGETLKQSIIIDNRPGGATNIGMDIVARAQGDGYTLLTASNSLASNAALFAKLNFDPAQDLIPVGAIGYAPLVVVVPSSSEFKTLQDMIAYGKANPDKLTYASAGNGSSGHLASELLKDEGKFNALHVPYKGGAPAITDMLGGRISFMAINPVEAIPHIKAGKMTTLAVLDSKPSALLPGVPTISSLGLPNAAASVWWGFCAPKGTPADVVAKLNDALNKALADASVQTRLSELGAVTTPGSAADFGKFVQEETVKWSRVIKAGNIKAD
ncbi:MAG TPA: tripartite tricarboxylate transporter substrate binding protein [Bordetella sp.]|nr:tripartite tricarboxylate transporter substrate binding protein [Bordetella sp.]